MLIARSLCAMFASALLLGCGKDIESAAENAPPPPEVTVVSAARETVPVIRELPGRLQATRTAEVRARVEGIVLGRVYEEGSDVRAGDVLFRLDPKPLRAAQASAAAALMRAEANLAQAQLTVDRYRPLLPDRAVSQQEFDNALTAKKQAEADVAEARAALTVAELDLSYATVTAPISGRAGRALVTEGALVGNNEATHLTTLEQIDPIYAYFTQSSSAMLDLRRAFDAGRLGAPQEARVDLLLEDGSPYPLPGKLGFSDLASDPSTGSITLRAEFPNPERLLLPGMYARVRLTQAVDKAAVTVPMRAVRMTAQGQSVLVVGADNKVVQVPVNTAQVVGQRWVIESGLKGGERVIVDGVQKAKPGMPVRPVAAKTTTPLPATNIRQGT